MLLVSEISLSSHKQPEETLTLTSPLTARPKKRSSNFILQFPINGEIVQKWKTIQILFVFPQTCNPPCGVFAAAAAVNGVTIARRVSLIIAK